jgi:AraC-like DNA-binding protein
MGRTHEATAPGLDSRPIGSYREFAPAPALRGVVRAYFSFIPNVAWVGHRTVSREVLITREEPFDLPMLADARSSLALDLGATCHAGAGWSSGAPLEARVLGARRLARQAVAHDCSEMVGAYLEPGATVALLGVPAVELTDRTVGLDEFWGSQATHVLADVAELGEAARVDRLEAALLERLRSQPRFKSSVDVLALTQWVQANPTSARVSDLADMVGVSRRHLTRIFREVVGVSPKRFSRLARFKTGLVYEGAGQGVQWAQVAAELGYADQSHMIAEFRELAGLTPEMLAERRWFHPFIVEMRDRHARRTVRRGPARPSQ